jgi:hypothetical protein
VFLDRNELRAIQEESVLGLLVDVSGAARG